MKNLLLLLLASLLMFTCKKKDDEPETQPVAAATTGGTTTGGSTTGNAFVTTSVNIIFTVSDNITEFNGTKFPSPSNRAYFSNSPQQFENASASLKMSKVLLNSQELVFEETSQFYMSGQQVSPAAATWSVVGANGFPSFEATSPLQPPTSSDVPIPDKISMSSGWTVEVNKVANMTNGMVVVQNFTSSSMPPMKALFNGDNKIVFTPSQIASVGAGSVIAIITMQNVQETVIQGKSVRFVAEKQFSKMAVVTN